MANLGAAVVRRRVLEADEVDEAKYYYPPGTCRILTKSSWFTTAMATLTVRRRAPTWSNVETDRLVTPRGLSDDDYDYSRLPREDLPKVM